MEIEILDSRDRLVRAFSSADKPEKITVDRYFAQDWIRPAALPSAAAGHHRLVWDLRYSRPKAAKYEYSIAAVWGHDTPMDPQGVLAPPGPYRVRLTVGGQSLVQPLTLRMDPRVNVSEEDLARQFDLARRTADDMNRDFDALERAHALARNLEERSKSAVGGGLAKSIADLHEKLKALTLGSAPDPFREDSLIGLSSRLTSVLSAVESADSTPTASAIAASKELEKALDRQLLLWKKIEEKDIPALNQRLRVAKLPLLAAEPARAR